MLRFETLGISPLQLVQCASIACAACGASHPGSTDGPPSAIDSEPEADAPADADAAPDLALDMPAARAVAIQTAAYLHQLAQHAYDQAGGEDYTTASARTAFAATYGPRQAEAADVTGFALGGELHLSTPGVVSFDTLRRRDGAPLLFKWGNGGMTLFFYQPTIVDPRDGAVYQGVVAAGTPTYPESTDAKVDVFGSILPPPNARLTGHFTLAQAQELSQILQQQ